MGETLNEYFASVFTVKKDMEGVEHGDLNSDILKNVHITEEEVLDVVKCIKVDKSRDLIKYIQDKNRKNCRCWVVKKIAEGRAVGLIYKDISKAFDKVPHGRL
eukprot:g24540.t1